MWETTHRKGPPPSLPLLALLSLAAESMAAGQVWGEEIARKVIERLKQAGYQDKT